MEFLQEELDEILNIFLQEGTEILQSMDKNLLALEKKPNNLDVAMHLFRDAHSLKGSARMLGYNGIQNIAHKIEDVLGLIREGKLLANSEITDAISDALSLIEILIKKTVEQKSEYVSEETNEHIKRLSAICDRANSENEAEEIASQEAFLHNFAKIEDLITGIILIYSKSINENNFEQFKDIIDIIGQLSAFCEEIQENTLHKLALNIFDLAEQSIQQNNQNEEVLLELNIKINNFVQELNKIARSKHIATKNYYEKADNISASTTYEQIEKNSENELKDAELIELVNKIGETLPDINKNKHSLAEIKSLLNELISRLNDNNFKKIYQTILQIVLNFEKSGSGAETDVLDALKEIFDATGGIIEARASKNVYNDFTEEIELLNQKTSIIAQMIKYELQNPIKKTIRQKKPTSHLNWAGSFDSASIKTLRVNSDKLDKLVNQIGNLIITRIKSRENQGIVKSIQDELIELQKYYHKIGYYMKFYEKKYVQEMMSKNPELAQKKDSFLGYNKQLLAFHSINMEKMNSVLNNLNILMKELQENNIKLNTATGEIETMVKSMRVLPLSTVFNLFPRMVHNIAKDKGKEIELLIDGGDITVDKKIIEDIKIPIMHIVRNSLDHGIEDPRQREKIGKSKTGNITIKATQKENKIIISVKDDGRGINIQKIKQKAVEKGFTTQDAADKMSKEQLANFIFYPGFSTGDTVTELSGRGLGLDIVHSKISQLNGRIDVYSEENKGTIVAMELPTSMATMKAFIIMEGERLLAIPANSIENVLRISKDDIQNREGRNFFIYKGEVVSICTLSSILNMPAQKEDTNKYTVIIIKSESTAIGIIVQKLIGDEEILNKKLPEPMLRVKNISGITTLANGEMCLLLNVSDILNSNKVNAFELALTKSLTLQDNSKYRILVVDDSITTRRLLGNILSTNGYVADIEADAKKALHLIENKNYDLIITDYEMPMINGLEFIKMLREKEKTKNIPIIMITSIEKPHLKEKVAEYNVFDFIKKEYFEQDEFIKIINKNLNFPMGEKN